jgi:hypothetical protein
VMAATAGPLAAPEPKVSAGGSASNSACSPATQTSRSYQATKPKPMNSGMSEMVRSAALPVPPTHPRPA